MVDEKPPKVGGFKIKVEPQKREEGYFTLKKFLNQQHYENKDHIPKSSKKSIDITKGKTS